MTCIVAVEHDGTVYMGSDRAGSSSWSIGIVDAPKTFRNGPLLIGYTTSFRMGQILQYGLTVPSHTLDWDVDRWVAIDLMGAVREAFEEHHWNKDNSGVAEGGSFLVAVEGRAYEVQTDYSAIRNVAGEYATGSGEDFARGSLCSTRGWDDPEARVLAALEAAAECSPSVAGPFDVVTGSAS